MDHHDQIRVAIISPPDREKLTAEFMIGGEQWAELSHEQGEFLLECYPRRDGQPWILPLESVFRALTEAKERLSKD